ncbi:MAG: elongation factor P maturation arginine rhamnosyltransferase EarP [Polaromonas sp.]|nr:elongation factor P maturation arginine rhamnosyltransferase EarP [Polaromonas sp.]
MDRRPPALNWDIFCKVIDNFGDVGVCWRLARDLASRGHQVRLWVDDASALQWMAPEGSDGVEVLPWADPWVFDMGALEAKAPDVLVEAFGCNLPAGFVRACAEIAGRSGRRPVWINLEYLSAEAYVERSHGLPSPVRDGPAAGWTKWFFYPGFTAGTGGLLREPSLAARQAAFNPDQWLDSLNLGISSGSQEKRISLFCYEPPALTALLQSLALQGLDGHPVHLLVAAGRPQRAVQALSVPGAAWLSEGSQLKVSHLPLLPQDAFDHLLWACDLNFVRGEDSIVRAIWAGKPFVWQIYPQDDDAHVAKLNAFLDMLDAPSSLRRFHHAWNAGGILPTNAAENMQLLQGETPVWAQTARAARSRLADMQDLGSQLVNFVLKNR